MASATAKSKPQKRRVQPQQVLPTQHPTSPVVTPRRKAVLVHDKLKEQAAIAERCLDPGRRVYVDIPQDGIVNYRKVLRNVGVDPRSKHKSHEPPGSPRGIGQPRGINPLISVIQRLEQQYQQAASDTESSSTSGHSSGMEEAEVEEDGQAAQGGEQEQATQQQGASGGDGAAAVVTATQGGDAAAAAGDGETVIDGAPAGAPAAPQPAKRKAIADLYDYDDEWIDDSELIEYFGGDQRRAKHKGFFINRGDIEREDGPPKASPQAGGAGGAGRKRRRKEPGGDAGGEGSAQANAPPETPQKKVVKKAAGAAAGAAAGVEGAPSAAATPARPPAAVHDANNNNAGAASPHQPSAHPTPQRVAAAPSGRENAPPAGHAAGVPGQQTSVQDGGVSSQHTSPPKAAVKPLAAPAQGSGDYALPPDVEHVLSHMQQLALKHSPPKDDKAKRMIPADVKAVLPQLIDLYTREGRKNQKAKRLILDAAMAFLEPFTSRPNLQRRLNEHFSNENKAAAAAQAGSSSQ